MIIVKGGVTTPKGFLASGVKAGIKPSGRPDLAILCSEVPATAAAAFTTNRFKASPVKVSMRHITNKTHQAIIVNSGNANCANAKDGDKAAIAMADYAAKAMGLGQKEVLVASTGIIGRPFPIEKIKAAMPEVARGLSTDGGGIFARTIMTTDTVPKEAAVKIRLGAKVVTIGGACKGVGMIYPVLEMAPHATMLCFITTDARISKKMLSFALSESIEDSFNMVSVDGDMSTNDTCFILANGTAGNTRITSKGSDCRKFVEALKFLTGELARKMAADGEGATKFVEIEITGARTVNSAKTIARKVSTSNLLKCCIYGEDPNWGRVAAACGAAGIKFDPDRVDIYLCGVKAIKNGSALKKFDENKIHKLMRSKNIRIKIDLKSGAKSAIAWTCDFSKEYVAINSEYST